MARKIASILEGGDPTEKGTSKFEKQRQRAEKYSIEGEAPIKINTTSNYRPLRQLSINDPPYFTSPDVPECIKHSLTEAQHSNTLRYVGAPEEFKQIHMQVQDYYISLNIIVSYIIKVPISKGLCSVISLYIPKSMFSVFFITKAKNIGLRFHKDAIDLKDKKID